MNKSFALIPFAVLVVAGFAAAACGPKKDDSAQPAVPGGSPSGYPSAGPGGYPTGGYATGAPTGYATTPGGYPPGAPTGYPTGPATASSPPLSAPGPFATPCQSDGQCGTFRCNTQVGKCVMPCQTANDCISGGNCMMGICSPMKMPGQP